jgi:hypothetical protein
MLSKHRWLSSVDVSQRLNHVPVLLLQRVETKSCHTLPQGVKRIFQSFHTSKFRQRKLEVQQLTVAPWLIAGHKG